ncbi:catalase [Flavobacterium sp. WLB]|uniref:Catalase n=1 Tax=Flavobacterium panici TaxID=2654843 RepID=A0A9N8J1W7_9FLAO|nr:MULTISPECIES: catalase [Flavobacterium]KOP39736.1 hydroperoxidase [Flavobacterium sp. VMW]OWU92518.1 hydroperoxidase [Flavobacterium sp. NLM]PUU71013.1 catalase [Flavobacterium sp. WLB]UUF12843.1 catalase [Flavobacterium panici]CAC9974736.1 catalase [Flavobacterium panici]
MKNSKKTNQDNSDGKQRDLDLNRSNGENQFLTTNQGVKINDNNNSLKAGERGPSLLEDFILREKITHFDHERIPERIVHARGSGAHGYFELYKTMEKYTKAGFLNNTSIKTPVFVRFSTVAGSRGSTDLARDVRGFAVKFYTQEGIFDLVGNNVPVFFIQDAMKFPDLIHAVKGEPHNEIPQAASAHDTFWDFISLMPESMHMVMWVMSDRAIPRSLRMMEGFGVHTFRFVNAQNESHFVKFHWKPKLGTHAVAWDEAQKISGKNSDFHKLDLWEAIDTGNFPEWELGVQIIPESDEHKYDFDLLDPTKLVPEELVPVTIIGRMVLDKNPDNFFAETEQVAFHPGHIVPGIDFTNDPLLQGRLFSYTDTQLSRLGSPNFHEIPINRTIAPMHNNQRDGHMRQEIAVGKVSYHPNSLGGGCPFQAKIDEGGFASFNERIDAHKIRERSESFSDHFSQAVLFYNSQTPVEQDHIANALSFELGKVETVAIRERMLGLLNQVDGNLASKVAKSLGIPVPKNIEKPINHGVGADDKGNHEPTKVKQSIKNSDALSMLKNPTISNTIATRQIAFLCAEGVNASSVKAMKTALQNAGAKAVIIAPHLGTITSEDGTAIPVDQTYKIAASVLFDGVFIPGGKGIKELSRIKEVKEFINDSYNHCKFIAAEAEGIQIIKTNSDIKEKDAGVLISNTIADKALNTSFIKALGRHRFWEREKML